MTDVKLAAVFLNILLFCSVMLLNIIVHESGHAIAYRINGIRFIMNFGKGEPLLQVSKCLVIRRRYLIFPFLFAYVQYHPEDEEKARSMPVRQEIFVTAAGVLSQLLLFILLIALSFCFSLPGPIQYYINGTIIVGLLLIASSVIPSPFHETDGVYIFRVLKRIRKNREKDR